MKKVTSLLLALVLILSLSLTACGSDPTGAAKAGFENGMNAFKNMNQDGINKYFTDADQLDIDALSASAGADMSEIFKALASNCTWKVLGAAQEDEDTIILTVEITNKDLYDCFNNASSDLYDWAIDAALNGENVTEEDVGNKLVELVCENVAAETDMITDDLEIEMTLDNGQWKIESNANGDLLTALTGGMDF